MVAVKGYVAEFIKEVSLMFKSGWKEASVVQMVNSTLIGIQGSHDKSLHLAIRKDLAKNFPSINWAFKEKRE